MRTVLLGGAGYIGSVLTGALAEAGHDVVVVDDFIYATDGVGRPMPSASVIRADFRDERVLRSVLPGADAVVHLGGLVGEPACAVNETLTVELNFAAPVLAGEVARDLGVPRYVFFSTCSVYGRQEGLVTEDTLPNPLSSYAWTKLNAERRLAELLRGRAGLAVLRLATVFGLSPRMRLDSVVNSMSARAAALGEIPLRGGSAWRPLVYVGDVAACVPRILEGAVVIALDDPLVLNVGDDAHNHTIAGIAETVVARVPGSRIRAEDSVTDHRDYRVSFARVAGLLPGACRTDIDAGIDEIAASVRAGRFADPAALEFDNLRGLRAALAESRTSVLATDEMKRLCGDYEDLRARARYDESAAAAYWGEERLCGAAFGDVAAEDAAVLCKDKPTAISAGYAAWEADCLERLLPDLAGSRVIDLGCGVGRLLPGLAARSKRVTGVDFAPGMLDRARRRIAGHQNADVLQGTLAEIPFPRGSADVVVCLGVFEHVTDAYRTRALAEIARVLRPGGQFLLELNNVESVLLRDAPADNPHRLGAQLPNGYLCELVRPEAVLTAAERLGLRPVDIAANPFFSAARHAAAGVPSTPEVFEHAAALDRGLGHVPCLRVLADQLIVRFVKR